MRSKEEAQDYRYFPEPDLPRFIIDDTLKNSIKSEIPELPAKRQERFIRECGLSEYDSGVLISEKRLADFFEECLENYKDAKNLCNWITGPLLSELNRRALNTGSLNVRPNDLVDLLNLIDEERINNLTAKQILSEMFDTDKGALDIVEKKNLVQISDTSQLDEIIDKVIKNNTKSVEDYKSGKINAIMFLVGCVMRQTKGKANPKVVKEMLESKLS